MPRDFGYEAQRAAEAHLEACEDAMDQEEGTDPSAWPESPAVGPYCGCQTCMVREVLHAAWPILQEAALTWAADDPQLAKPECEDAAAM